MVAVHLRHDVDDVDDGEEEKKERTLRKRKRGLPAGGGLGTNALEAV